MSSENVQLKGEMASLKLDHIFQLSNLKMENNNLKNENKNLKMKRSKKVTSKFGVYEFRVSSKFQLVIACLLFLNMISQLSMVKSLYLYSSK